MYTYRICQNDNFARGAYDHSLGINNCPLYESDYDRHPLPEMDSLLKNNAFKQNIDLFADTSYYAFRNISQLRAWFYNDAWLQWLYDNGFSVVKFKIDVKFVVQGNAQCVIVLSEAKEVRKLSINEVIS